MFRHVIAPARSFSQVPNEIIRHPRLSAVAVRLLTWQLSLPPSADESLSKTASRAGLGKSAFQNAKRELLREGYLHQWREQRDGGHWVTHQLVSNVPLGPQEAAAARGDVRGPTPPSPPTDPDTNGVVGHQPARSQHPEPSGAPTAALPTTGVPTGPSVGRQPPNTLEENTTHQPPEGDGADANVPAPHENSAPHEPSGSREVPAPHEPSRESAPPEPAPVAARAVEAEQLLRSLGQSDPRLVLPARTVRSWAPLAARWLERGVPAKQAHSLLTEGLTGVRSPLGVLRWRLEHALPDTLTPSVPAPTPSLPAGVAAMRECAGSHTQPRLFRPVGDEEWCSDCREACLPHPARVPNTPGYAAFCAARQACGRGNGLSLSTVR